MIKRYRPVNENGIRQSSIYPIWFISRPMALESFSGEVTPENYNKAWWELREKYQGVQAPIARSEADFDPGAKYHVPGNTPYTRYFLAHILQFDFHRSLCEIAGNEEAIHRCSVYNSAEAGEKLNAMLEMGSSRPWQEALATITGKEEMDATHSRLLCTATKIP